MKRHSLYLTNELLEDLKTLAAQSRRSFNQYVQLILEEKVKEEKKKATST